MNSNYKKIIIGLILLSFAVVMGFLIFKLFFQASLNPNIDNNQNNTPGNGLPTAGDGSNQNKTDDNETKLPTDQTSPIIKPTNPNQPTTEIKPSTTNKLNDLTTSPAFKPKINSNGTLQYYNQDNNRFYRVDATGKIIQLSDKQFYEVKDVTWSPTKNKAILEYPDKTKIIYDFDSQKQITLPSHWEDFDFSPDGEKLVFKSIGIDTENRWLAVSSDDGSQIKKIESLGEKADQFISSWSPNNQSVGMFTEGIDFNRKEVYFIGLNGENFKSTVTEGRGFQPKWAPEGDKLLYSVYSNDNDYKPQLWLVNAQGDNIGSNRQPLAIETWAEKCTFNGNTQAFCAVPETLERGAGMFPETAKTTKDNLYKIDLNTGLKTLIPMPENNYNMSNIMVSNDGKTVYFTDALTQRLHQLQIQ